MTPAQSAKHTKANSPNQVGTYMYVDNYTAAAVENAKGRLLGRVACSALHGIHLTFPPLVVTGHHGGKDPISLKKLQKGDAQWNHEKEILGFLVNGLDRTVWISNKKASSIIAEIKKILKKKRQVQLCLPPNHREAPECGPYHAINKEALLPNQQGTSRRARHHRAQMFQQSLSGTPGSCPHGSPDKCPHHTCKITDPCQRPLHRVL
jgi:hypothetical protein